MILRSVLLNGAGGQKKPQHLLVQAKRREHNQELLAHAKYNKNSTNAFMRKKFWVGVRAALQRLRRTDRHGTGLESPPLRDDTSTAEDLRRKLRSDTVTQISQDPASLRWMILPTSPWKTKWDMLVGVMIIFCGIVIPLRICFDVQVVLWSSSWWIDTSIDIAFTMDMLFCFREAYLIDSPEQDGTQILITDYKKIAQNYVKSWFPIDFVAVFPFEYIIPTSSSGDGSSMQALKLVRMVRLIRLLRLLKLFKLSKLVENLDPDADIDPLYISLCGLIVKTVGMAHLVACFWFFISGDGLDTETDNWVDNPLDGFNLRNATVDVQYITSLYWTVATMLAVGYGDIYAMNTKERVYSIFTELSGAIMFGAVVGTIGVILASSDRTGIVTKEKMDSMKSYLAERKVPKHLQLAAKNALRYYLKHRSPFDEQSTLANIPYHNRNELIHTVYQPTIKRIKLFKSLSNSADSMGHLFVAEIVLCIKPVCMPAGELVVEEGDLCGEVSFVTQGNVVFTKKVETRAELVYTGSASKGNYFGDYEYEKKCASVFQVTSTSLVTMCCILNIDFRRITLRFPTVHDTINSEITSRTKSMELVLSPKNDIVLVEEGVYEKQLQLENGALVKSRYCKQDSYFPHIRTGLNTVQAFQSVLSLQSSGPTILDSLEEPVSHTLKRQKTSVTSSILFSSVLEGKYLIDPDCNAKIKWDIFIGILIMWSVLFIPYKLGFTVDYSLGMEILEFTNLFFFVVDLLLSFRTAYIDPKTEILEADQIKIAKRYLRTWFIVDFLSIAPFDLILDKVSSSGSGAGADSTKLVKIIRLFRLIKLVRLMKLSQYMDKIEDEVGIQPAVFNLITLMMRVTLVAHFAACFFVFVTNEANSGLMDDDTKFEEQTNLEEYIAALYWAFTTMTTVGYGDIVPEASSVAAKAYVIGMMVIGATVFAYLLANVASALDSLRKPRDLFSANMKMYFESKNVPIIHSRNARRHWQYMQSQSSDKSYVIEYLPSRLMRLIQCIAHKDTIKKISCFRHIENPGVVLQIFHHLQPASFQAGMYLFRKYNVLYETYFVTAGTCDVLDGDNEELLFKGTNGDIIGKEGLMFRSLAHSTLHLCSARAHTPTEVYLLSDIVLYELVELYPSIEAQFQKALAKALQEQRDKSHHRARYDDVYAPARSGDTDSPDSAKSTHSLHVGERPKLSVRLSPPRILDCSKSKLHPQVFRKPRSDSDSDTVSSSYEFSPLHLTHLHRKSATYRKSATIGISVSSNV